MTKHRFKVGQMVDFTSSQFGVVASMLTYKVMRQLPPENGQQLYRIKAAAEIFERVARESELARPSSTGLQEGL